MANKLDPDVPVHTGSANDHDRIEQLSLKQGNGALQIGAGCRLAGDDAKCASDLIGMSLVGIKQKYTAHSTRPSEPQGRLHRVPIREWPSRTYMR
jgi:hypothetical protein